MEEEKGKAEEREGDKLKKHSDEASSAFYLLRLSSHDYELVGPLHEETREFVAKHLLQLVCLLNLDADTD